MRINVATLREGVVVSVVYLGKRWTMKLTDRPAFMANRTWKMTGLVRLRPDDSERWSLEQSWLIREDRVLTAVEVVA